MSLFLDFIQTNGFTNIKPLDEGANAHSFKAYDNTLNRDVFLKYYETCEESAESILSEPRKVSAIFSDNLNAANNLAIIYSTKEVTLNSDKYIEIITEYCDGNSLYNRLQNDTFFLYEAIEYTKQIIDGLHILHSKNIIHRDVKPSNLVISNGRIKIIDLGAATELKGGADFINSQSKHSIFYRPPEAFPPSNIFGKFSDIYQTGIVLYEMINGPIKENPDHYLVKKIVSDYEKTISKEYVSMDDFEKTTVQDMSIKHLAEKSILLSKGKSSHRFYSKTMQSIVDNFVKPKHQKRISRCSEARLLLSNYTGPNWKQNLDGVTLVNNYKGNDYTFREYKNKKGESEIECMTSKHDKNNYRKNNKLKNWDAIEKFFLK